MKIEIDEIDVGLDDFLEVTPAQVYEMSVESAKKGAVAGRKGLKTESPKQYGKYASGWRIKNNSTIMAGAEFVIHNGKKPHLVHLLDDGHELIVHGKRVGRVSGHPHYKNNKERAGDVFEEHFDDGLQKII